MKLYFSLFAFAVSIATSFVTAESSDKPTNSGRRRLATTTTESSLAANQICFPTHRTITQPEVALFHSLATRTTDESFTGLTDPGETLAYSLGCGFLDFSCYACSLCQDMFGALVATGSEAACDAACVGIAELTGGGPEDPIADMVAAACIPLCEAIFSNVAAATPQAVCSTAHVC